MDENEPITRSLAALDGGGTLLGVWAHPDDEAYLSAGLMARTVARGGRVVVAYATRGEAGTDDPVAWPPAALARRREGEAKRALRAIGAEGPRWLGHADGGCSTVELPVGTAAVEAVLHEVDPDVVVTFGSDGITGHADHRAVSRWTVAAWQSLARGGRPGGRPAPALLLAAMAPGFVHRHRALHADLGLFGPDGPRATPDADLVLRLQLRDVELDRKGEMLAAHASQTAALAAHLGPDAFRHWWAEECFRAPDAIELDAASDVPAA